VHGPLDVGALTRAVLLGMDDAIQHRAVQLQRVEVELAPHRLAVEVDVEALEREAEIVRRPREDTLLESENMDRPFRFAHARSLMRIETVGERPAAPEVESLKSEV
jgi:hypothetical protein